MYRPRNGYAWIDEGYSAEGMTNNNELIKGPLLVNEEGDVNIGEFFNLSDIPTLFMDFAEIYKSPRGKMRETVIRFANQHGWLGITEDITRQEEGGRVEQAESLNIWISESREMWWCAKVWKWIESENYNQLSRYIKWTGPKRVLMEIDYESDTLFGRRKAGPDDVYGFRMKSLILQGVEHDVDDIMKSWSGEVPIPHLMED